MTNRTLRDHPQAQSTTVSWPVRPLFAGLVAATLAAFALLVSIAIGWPMPASAVHDDGHFELDGNIPDWLAAGPDWGSVFDSSGSVANVDSGLVGGFLVDDISAAVAVGDLLFTAGGA